jgi:hypothetical protein
MHGRTHKTLGLTLIEMTLVIGTMVLLVGFAVPAVRSLTHSFQSEGAVKSMIDAALSSARAMAMTRQRYVGVRFQKLCTSDDPADPLKGILDAPQYMIFIMSEEPKKIGNLRNGFRAVDGLDPVKLPSTVGVMDLGGSLVAPVDPARDATLADATTFSIVFSPSGRLLVHSVRARNRQGRYQPRNDPGSGNMAHDDIFNSPENICLYHEGKFIQDDYSNSKNSNSTKESVEFGLGEESSVTSFVIYDTATLRTFYKSGAQPLTALSDYLNTLSTEKSVHVSSYSGHLILSD